MRVVVYAIVALIVTGMIIVMVGPALAAPVGGAGAVGGVGPADGGGHHQRQARVGGGAWQQLARVSQTH